ncbi:MAG: M56 family metallopeptidase, partial [Firmicutes bacterium]|nr:M56 family metallopeptidase [Bacillota bacterium]
MTLLQMLTGLGPVFYKLVYMSLTGLAAGAIVLLLRRLADKRFSPFWKYAMWLLVLAALVVPWRPQSRAAVLSPAEAVQDMDTFDVEAWKASTVIQVAWDIEAITHAVYLDMRAGPTKIDPYALSQTEEYDF